MKLDAISVRADIAFPRKRIAVFVDGCFWHGCPKHLQWPKANGDWWHSKINGNRARDQRVNVALTEAGWTVIRAWEHDDVQEIVTRVSSASAAGDGAGQGVVGP